VLAPAETTFTGFLRRPDNAGRMRHIVVTQSNRIVGVLRVNTGLRQASEEVQSQVTLGEIANRNFTLVRSDDVVFDVIQRIYRRGAVMALVVDGRRGVPRPEHVQGVITKEHVADSVASSVNVYQGS